MSEKLIVPIEVSARHVHLSQYDLEKLFGSGYKLTKQKDLSQNQFAAQETVVVKSTQGQIENVRVVGPTVEKTAVAISASDAYRLGISPPFKECENLDSGALITLQGPRGLVQVLGAIIVQRHLHLSLSEADNFRLKAGDLVKIKISGPRGLVFENVLVKVGPNFKLAFHLDLDEANAAAVKTGDKGELILF